MDIAIITSHCFPESFPDDQRDDTKLDMNIFIALITVGFVASSLPLVAGVGMTCTGSNDVN